MSKRTPALGFILITVFIDILGIFIIVPILPKLLIELGNLTTGEASREGTHLVATYAVMQFICAPILGGLSDKYGRRPVLLISLFGLGLDYIFLGLAPTISLLFLGRVLAGMCGASFTTASAYIADVSPVEKRAKNFGLLGATFALGFVIGPSLGGILGDYGLRVPFYFSAALTLLNLLYGFFVLPESLPIENRRKFEWKRANPFSSLARLKRNKIILGLSFALFFTYIAAHSVQSTWAYFGIEVFDWDEIEIGISLSIVGLMLIVVQGYLIGKATKKLGNKKTIYLGLFFNLVGLILFSLIKEEWMLYSFLIIYVLGALAGPTLQATMSSQVPNNEQGELQGALTSLMSLSSIFGPILMGETFYFFTKNEPYFPGAPFALGAVFSLICLILCYRTLRKVKEPKAEEVPTSPATIA